MRYRIETYNSQGDVRRNICTNNFVVAVKRLPKGTLFCVFNNKGTNVSGLMAAGRKYCMKELKQIQSHFCFKIGDKVRPQSVSDGVITKLLPRGMVEIRTKQDGLQTEPASSLELLELAA
jgi:hypothetical protein